MHQEKYFANKIKKYLHTENRIICLTSDIWTSRNRLGILSLTAYYIDSEWNLNKIIISFKILETPYTGYNIGNVIIEKLQCWGITDKIFLITLDNATNNDVAETFLKQKIEVTFRRYIISSTLLCTYFKFNCTRWFASLSSSIEKIKDIVSNIIVLKQDTNYIKNVVYN